ncbi:LysM peptidoglycan-binding domain-containing protein [Selenomonas flueggei]|uniref:LysM peptidoglycan-binding domain-containing protein n=1 Tax=Selenomonas flueggei TaxID=135080 RepID=UPI0026736F54|nr:LysM domain-containing protein [Selenomonas flueggei]
MRNWKAAVAGGIVAGAAILCAGMATQEDTHAVLVEEVYVVRPGDTIWGIAEEYCAKNTGTRRYILEYKSGMEELNPWLMERKGEIYPGDEIKVTYWVKEEQE